jgi:hypothetical protein
MWVKATPANFQISNAKSEFFFTPVSSRAERAEATF